MSKIIGIIYKLKSVFPTTILRSIYNFNSIYIVSITTEIEI